MADPTTVRCTLCMADIGAPCRTRTGGTAPRPHRQRVVRVAMYPNDDRVLAEAFPPVGTCPTCARPAQGRAFPNSPLYHRCLLGHVWAA